MIKRFWAIVTAACLCLALFACGSGQAGLASAQLRAGAYTGTGTGHGGPIEVQLTVDDEGRIADVQILGESETPEYAARALELLPAAMIEKQSLGLDAVAGATLSSNGILAAVADAIAKAGGDPKDYGFTSVGERADGAEIVFTGLPGGDFILTGAQLKAFGVTELDALSVNSKGTEKTVHAKGVLLETILQSRGLSQKDFGSVTAAASDGYTITLPDRILQGRDILIAFETDGEEIPLRFVVPGERAMYWVKLVSSIAFEAQTQPVPVTREIPLGELLAPLLGQAEDYEYKGAVCRALPIALLLEALGMEPDALEADFVTIISADGLTKTEKYDTFALQVLVLEGTPDAPLYTGPDLPEGMRVKNVSSLQIGGILIKAD